MFLDFAESRSFSGSGLPRVPEQSKGAGLAADVCERLCASKFKLP